MYKRNQLDIQMTAHADASKEQTDIPFKCGHQILTQQSMGNQVCPTSETCHTTISESDMIILMSRGRSNCGATNYVSN